MGRKPDFCNIRVLSRREKQRTKKNNKWRLSTENKKNKRNVVELTLFPKVGILTYPVKFIFPPQSWDVGILAPTHRRSRFLDDIFSIWPGTYAQLLEYETFLNQLIPGIKIKFTAHHQIIEFLDTYIYKHTEPDGTCTLQTKIHFKTTDTHQLLHRSSFHPSHTFNSIIRSQFIRFKRISSSFLDFQEASSVLIKVLRQRGYSHSKLLKNKRDIWHNYSKKPSDNNSVKP